MTAEEPNDSTTSQWLRGVLDLCLMAVVADEPAYGYEMTRRLRASGLSVVSEGSIYPALARLERAKLLESFRVASDEGPMRKYYRLSRAGTKALTTGRNEWHTFSAGVAEVLGAAPPRKLRATKSRGA